MTLPVELRKAERVVFYYEKDKENYRRVEVTAIPSHITASFLEKKRKELKEKSFEMVDGTQKCGDKDCDSYGKPHGHRKQYLKLSDANAVFGGEEKNKGDEET